MKYKRDNMQVVCLKKYLEEWQSNYEKNIVKINLFQQEKTKTLSIEQKQKFVRLFYHLRGHFHDFLWYLGSTANDKETKDLILENIKEEFNGSAISHEEMYYNFAEELGVDLRKEFAKQEFYHGFVKSFNREHILWLADHTADECFSAFAAYEKLDNVDYNFLLKLVESWDLSYKSKVFFKVHSAVQHFEPSLSKLEKIWEADKNIVIKGFQFIASHQLSMWQTLSKHVF